MTSTFPSQAFEPKESTDSAASSLEDNDGYTVEQYALRSISSKDAISLLTAAYQLTSEEAAALLQPSPWTKENSHNVSTSSDNTIITPGSFCYADLTYFPV